MSSNVYSLAVFCALLFAEGAQAQGRHDGPGGPPPGLRPRFGGPPALERMLSLNDEQKVAFESLKKEQREAARPLHDEQRWRADQLRLALDADKPDALTVGRRAIALKASREKLTALHDQFHAKLEAILDEDQKQKLQLLRDMREDGPPPPFDGGSSGPRGFGGSR